MKGLKSKDKASSVSVEGLDLGSVIGFFSGDGSDTHGQGVKINLDEIRIKF